MAEHAAEHGSRVPTVLRRVPSERVHRIEAFLGRAAGRPGETWWELVDIADERDSQALAVVVVSAQPDDPHEITLVSVRTQNPQDERALVLAVTEIVAVIRATPARLLRAAPRDEHNHDLLVRAGFNPDGSGGLILEF